MIYPPGVVVAPGVTRTEFGYGYFLEGKKQQLIAAGILDASAFASLGTCDKRGLRRSIRGTCQGRPFTGRHRAPSDDYVLTFYYGGTELEMQERIYREQLSRQRAQDGEARRRHDAGFQRFMKLTLGAAS